VSVCTEDVGRLRDLDLTLTVNGEVRQQDDTKNLVYGVAETLSELSAVQELTRR
jgi:2-keto-4-pentenoate hydratase/2-oxohepta-3-ene-1,7-dioic acid hydratase in catechol pathway